MSTETKTALYHTSCKTLLLAPFIEAMCNDDLKGIVISGEPTEQQLRTAWEEIASEYYSYMKSEASEYVLQLTQDISLLQWHITYVDSALLYLRQKFHKRLKASFKQEAANEMIEELKGLGYYRVNYDEPDPIAYLMQMDRIRDLATTKVVRLKEMLDEFDRHKKTQDGKAMSEEEFGQNIAMLGKYQCSHINTRVYTVFEYAMVYCNYMREHKELQKSQAA